MASNERKRVFSLIGLHPSTNITRPSWFNMSFNSILLCKIMARVHLMDQYNQTKSENWKLKRQNHIFIFIYKPMKWILLVVSIAMRELVFWCLFDLYVVSLYTGCLSLSISVFLSNLLSLISLWSWPYITVVIYDDKILPDSLSRQKRSFNIISALNLVQFQFQFQWLSLVANWKTRTKFVIFAM